MMKMVMSIWTKMVKAWPLTQRWGALWGARTLFLALAATIALIVLAFTDWSTGPVVRHFAKVKRDVFQVKLIESGDVEAVSQRGISAPMMWGAKLQIIGLVPEGTLVKKGDFLVQFDAADLEANLDLAMDNLETLKADLSKLDAQQQLAVSNQKNSVKLSQYSLDQAKLSLEMQQFESDIKREEARIALKQAELDLETSGTQLKSQKIIQRSERMKKLTAIRQAEMRVSSIKDRIQQMQLTAPIDGMVVYQYYRGERVKEGLEARPGQPLISIPDMERMRIKIYINEVDRLKIQPGQAATITLDAYPELEFNGEVVEVARLAQTVRHDMMLKGFEAHVAVHGSDQRLRPGMTAKVNIVLASVEDALIIPMATLHEKDGETVVFLKGKRRPHRVTLGLRNDGYAEVHGLKVGQELQWSDPRGQLPLYGYGDEKKRVEEIRSRLGHSFSVFKERGILHNYLQASPATEKTGDEGKEGPASEIDISKLPASLRNRLEKTPAGKAAVGSVSVGEPEKVKTGQMKLSPALMKRLENTKKSQTKK